MFKFLCIEIMEAQKVAALEERLAHQEEQIAHLVQENREKENEIQDLNTSLADFVKVG